MEFPCPPPFPFPLPLSWSIISLMEVENLNKTQIAHYFALVSVRRMTSPQPPCRIEANFEINATK